jgi:hypothetical protein
MNYSQDNIWIMIRGEIMVNNNLNINLNSTVPLNSINHKSNQHRESFPLRISQDSTQDVTARWRGDGGDEGAGDGDDDDDDPDEVLCNGDDDSDDLPSLGRNFPADSCLPESFSLSGVFCPAEAVVSISEPPFT